MALRKKNTHRTSSLCWSSTKQPKEKLRFVQCAAENEKKKTASACTHESGEGTDETPLRVIEGAGDTRMT